MLEPHDKDEPDIALLLSGQVRAYLSCGEQEITIFNAEQGFPILVASGLVLRARRESEILLAPRATFLEVMMSTPELYCPMYMALERLLTQTLHIIEGMRFLNVRERLIRYIVDLSDQYGQTMLDGRSIPFEHTIEAVANDIGSSRQTTSQTLNCLIKEGHIRRVSRTQLLVLNITGLKKTLREANLAHKKLANIALGTSRNEAYTIFSPRSQSAEAKDEDARPIPPLRVSKH